jgi:hypothetical protein
VSLRTQASSPESPRRAGRNRLRGRWQALAAGVAVAIGCAGCSGTTAPAPVGTVVSGPIQILVTARSVDQIGDPIGVTSFYRAESHAATAVALLGRLNGPQTLVMTWSRVTPSGPQVLFSQHLRVTSYGRAYGTAVTHGTMPTGIYQVSVSVAGATRTAKWGVYTPKRASPASLAKTAMPLTAGPAASLPQPSTPARLCQQQHFVAAIHSPSVVDLNVSAFCPESGANKVTRGTVLATMNRSGGVRLIGMMRMQPDGLIVGNFRFNVCDLPSGSDVPGSRLGITTIIYYNGSTRSFTFSSGLPGEIFGPTVTISSSVPPGTPVHPGQEIHLKVAAAEPDGLGPQPGIGNVKVLGPDGLIKFVRYPRHKTGCEKFRGYRVVQVTYRVPVTTQKSIKISATSSDLPGATATSSVTFPVTG